MGTMLVFGIAKVQINFKYAISAPHLFYIFLYKPFPALQLCCMLLAGRAAYKLYVDALDLIAPESLSSQMRLDHCYELVIYHILENMVLLIVQMHMLECVDIKVHLVVGTESIVINAQHCHVGEDVVHRCYCHLSLALLGDDFCDYVSRGMSERQHCFMYCESLRSGFERVLFEEQLELLDILAFVCIHVFRFDGKDMHLAFQIQNKFENF